MENVENYTKEIPKMCKIPHFPHFNEIYSPLDVPLTPSGGLSCLCLTVVVLATPKENVFCKSSITHHDFPAKSGKLLITKQIVRVTDG